MATPKIDPKVIFASNAPAQDKPAQFENYTRGMDETRKRDGRPTIKQFNFLQEQTDKKILWIHENGGALPYDSTIDYQDGAIVLKDGELQQKSGADWSPIKRDIKSSDVKDESGKTQQELNDNSIYIVGSISAMLSLSAQFYSRVVKIKATQAMYQYLPENEAINDGFRILNGWTLIGFNDVLLATLAGFLSDGSDEYTKLKSLLDVSSALNTPIDLCGLNVTTSPIIATGNLKLVGRGGIKLINGATSSLITSAYDFVIDGEITIDPNKLNVSGTVSGESHCSIKHTGDNLILKNGATIKPSASNNVSCRAKKNLIIEDANIEGGQIGLYAIVPLAKVVLRGGTFKESTLYDNIAIYNAEDVFINGITSHSSTRSGIVLNNTSKKSRLIGNLCYGNKRDASNQGGWGIVLSVNALDSTVSSNVCIGNQTGGITLDTFPASGVDSLDNRITVTGNVINGLYNNTYSTTGISLNDATHAVVTGNNIYKVAQGIATDSALFANISANIVQDVTAYFVQLYRSNGSIICSNNFNGCSNTSGGALSFTDTNNFKVSNNKVENLTGAAGNAVRVSGACADWEITHNKIIRSVVGSGFVFHILGATNTGGIIRGNTIKSKVSGGWQWYLVSDNAAAFSSHDNIIEAVGTNYIYQGNASTAGDDTHNGNRNLWASAPAFKSRTGQVSVIASVLKYWNGSSWV